METSGNIRRLFERALQTASQYRLYARRAQDEGYMQIADIFRQTADNELEHAAVLWELSAQCRLPATAENLAAALDPAQQNDYEACAVKAEQDGLPETAFLLRQLAGVRKNHTRRFRILAENLRRGAVFQKDEESYWLCRVCGALHRGRSAPQSCPVCGYPQGCFSLYAEDF